MEQKDAETKLVEKYTEARNNRLKCNALAASSQTSKEETLEVLNGEGVEEEIVEKVTKRLDNSVYQAINTSLIERGKEMAYREAIRILKDSQHEQISDNQEKSEVH